MSRYCKNLNSCFLSVGKKKAYSWLVPRDVPEIIRVRFINFNGCQADSNVEAGIIHRDGEKIYCPPPSTFAAFKTIMMKIAWMCDFKVKV